MTISKNRTVASIVTLLSVSPTVWLPIITNQWLANSKEMEPSLRTYHLLLQLWKASSLYKVVSFFQELPENFIGQILSNDQKLMREN